jgi:2-oxoglutarate dehydrogenase complex dehydrogenase (E1) component-like enzyme
MPIRYAVSDQYVGSLATAGSGGEGCHVINRGYDALRGRIVLHRHNITHQPHTQIYFTILEHLHDGGHASDMNNARTTASIHCYKPR